MFTSSHLAKKEQNSQLVQLWSDQYFADSAKAIELALQNPEYLGWLKVLLGPKVDARYADSHNEIMFLESELHLNLVALNVVMQSINSEREDLVFNLINNIVKRSPEDNETKIKEIAAVKNHYVNIRNDHLNGHENKLWYNINNKSDLVESDEIIKLYSETFILHNPALKRHHNRFASYKDLFTSYSNTVDYKSHNCKIRSEDISNKLIKHFEYELAQLLSYFYHSWDNRFSKTKYSEYNNVISKDFSKILKNQISAILDLIPKDDEINLSTFSEIIKKKITQINHKISNLQSNVLHEVEEYNIHVKNWMYANKNLIPEKYKYILPEYLAKTIIDTNVHTIGLEHIVDAQTGDTLLHKAAASFGSNNHLTDLNRIVEIVVLLLERGANALSKNNNNAIALDFTNGLFNQQLIWKLLGIQLKNLSFTDAIPHLISQELIKYIELNDSYIKTVTHNTEIKKSRLKDVLKIINLICEARYERIDQKIIDTLVILHKDLSKESSALYDALDEIINKVSTSELSNYIKIKKLYYTKKPLTTLPNTGYELYLKYYDSYLHNFNEMDQERKYNDLYLSCFGLIDAAILGNADAKAKLVSTPKNLLSFDMLNLVNNEYICRLEQLLLINDNKTEIYKRLAKAGSEN